MGTHSSQQEHESLKLMKSYGIELLVENHECVKLLKAMAILNKNSTFYSLETTFLCD